MGNRDPKLAEGVLIGASTIQLTVNNVSHFIFY